MLKIVAVVVVIIMFGFNMIKNGVTLWKFITLIPFLISCLVATFTYDLTVAIISSLNAAGIAWIMTKSLMFAVAVFVLLVLFKAIFGDAA